ncbi:MAG: HAD family hydrolase [Candidatus Altiarchaeota archaeon]
MVKAVLFDWDGTLYDIFDFMVTTYTEVMRERGVRTWTREEYRNNFRIEWRDMLEEMGLKDDEEFLIEKWRENMKTLKEKLRLHEGVIETLEKLKEKHSLGIITSGPRKALNAEMKRLGVKRFMDITVAGGEAGNGKPEPDPLVYAMEKLGLDPVECAYVGDMIEDVQAAKKAGMHSIAVSWGLHNRKKLSLETPDFIADDLNEMVEYIEGIK